MIRLVAITFGIVILATAMVVVAPVFARQSAMTVIVDRKAGSVELFVGVEASGLSSIFALPPAVLSEIDGTVDFAKLREGTWDAGDLALSSVHTKLGDEAIDFEAMSLMVHPNTLPVRFEDPLDAIIAVGVCSVDAPDTPLTLNDLHSYAAYIGYAEETDRPIALRFSRTGRAAKLVEIRDFTNGTLTKRSWTRLGDGGTLVIGG